MKTQRIKIKVSEPIGSVSGEFVIPEKPECILTIAHGAGAGMDHPFMKALATSLAENNIATLRFNFPFTENKKGRPDLPAVAHKTIDSAIIKAHEKFPKLSLFISGKSFGGRMSSQYLSAHKDPVVKGIIFYGFPLHAPGKPSIDRADHLKDVKVPMLFLSGTRDEFATLELIEEVTSKLKLATLIKIEGANHGFKAGKENLIPRLAAETKSFVQSLGTTKKL